jgi:hypothetical protein
MLPMPQKGRTLIQSGKMPSDKRVFFLRIRYKKIILRKSMQKMLLMILLKM